MIKRMQHAYIQDGEKFFAFIEPTIRKCEVGERTEVTLSDNFYVFDANGFLWFCMTHVDSKFVLNGLGNGFLKSRTVWTIEAPVPAFRSPIVETDEWIQGNFDKGYALETIKGALGLNLTYLTQLIKEEQQSES